MRLAPSIVPGTEQDIYLVLDHFGERLGRAWVETDEERTDRDTLLRDLMDGQYRDPQRIVAFNTSEGWSRDVSEEIAEVLSRLCAGQDELPQSLEDFLQRHGHRAELQLSLL